jgi:hypothetical protein
MSRLQVMGVLNVTPIPSRTRRHAGVAAAVAHGVRMEQGRGDRCGGSTCLGARR